MTCFICDADNPDADPEGCAACDRDAEYEVKRLLAAIHPTRRERALSWFVGRCYDRNVLIWPFTTEITSASSSPQNARKEKGT
jgi:hypothetical protein